MTPVRVSPENHPQLSKCSLWDRLEQRWNSLQVGRQGSYSVERLESLQNYCKATSRTRVVLVCILTPLPPLATAVLLECLPLRPPSEGWRANWMFWLRFGLMSFTLCLVGITELVVFLPNLKFTLGKRLFVSTSGTAALMAVCLVAASLVGFPVPFVWQFGGLVLGSCVPALVLLVFGRKAFAKNSPSRVHLQRFVQFLFAYMGLIVVYPFFRVLYDFVPPSYRGYTTVLLPMWRLAAEHYIIRNTRELEDFVPEIIAFSVDFMSALFVSACISASGPVYLSVLFIAADIGQVLLEFREVRANAHTVVRLLQLPQKSQQDHDLVAGILAVTRNPTSYRITSLKDARLRACLPHPLTQEQENRLREQETSGIYRCTGSATLREVSAPTTRLLARSNNIVPASPEDVARASSTRFLTHNKARGLVVQGLQLLFHCEYLVQVEYVECVVPLIFTLYKSILHSLPNAAYYPGGMESWSTSATVHVLVFAALEAISLFLFNEFLQRKFAFSPLYQLAFVLETQMYVIQASLFLKVVTLMQYELAHLGEC